MDRFIGCMVSLDCGEILGVYQGQVDSINPAQGTITLVRSFRNGIPYKLPHVTLRSQDINHLEIIRSSEDVKLAEEKEHFNILLSERSMDGKVDTPKSPKPKIAPIKQLVVFGQNKNETRVPAFSEISFNPKIYSTSSEYLMLRFNGTQSKQKVVSATPPNNIGKNQLSLENDQFQRFFESITEDDMSKAKLCNKVISSPQIPLCKWPTTKHKELSKNQHARPSNSFTEHFHQQSLKGFDNQFSPLHKPNRSAKRNNSECFDHCDGDFDEDFDFEKNLALFDKAAVAQEMKGSVNNLGGNVRPSKNGFHNHQEKYKCDENILKGVELGKRQIFLVNQHCGKESILGEYSTDSGLIVPGISHLIRERLLSMASKMEFSRDKIVEAFGRCISDVILQYLGGSTRFEAKNFHQRPIVVILCGSNQWQSAAAIACGRLLSNRLSHVIIYHLPPSSSLLGQKEDSSFSAEMNFFKMTGGLVVTEVKDLPVLDNIDLVISTLDCESSYALHVDAAKWATSKKAPVFSIEPFAGPPSLESKRSFVCGLPGWYDNGVGQVCFCDVGIPESIYRAAGINFKSPFFDKFFVTLHKVN